MHIYNALQASLLNVQFALNAWKQRTKDTSKLALTLAPYQQFTDHLNALLIASNTKLTPEEKTAIFDRAIQFSNYSAVKMIIQQLRGWATRHTKQLMAMTSKNFDLLATIIGKSFPFHAQNDTLLFCKNH